MPWFLVHTQPTSEQRAVGHLRRQGFTVYLPQHLRRRSHARRVELVKRPLFPRYLFVNFDPAVDRWRTILGTFGVSNLVRFGNEPVRVARGLVEALQSSESQNAFDDRLDAARELASGTKVRVLSGPFADLIGKFQRLSDAERVVVLLDLLGSEVQVSLPNGAIAAV